MSWKQSLAAAAANGDRTAKKIHATVAGDSGATRREVAKLERECKETLLMTRPDLPAAKRAELLSQPLDVVRFAVKDLPAYVPVPTSEELSLEKHIDRAMGLDRRMFSGVQVRAVDDGRGGSVLSMGPMTPDEARARLHEIEEQERAGLR